MFLLFWLSQKNHPQLGFIFRRKGLWNGTISLLFGGQTLFKISGNRRGPDAAAVDRLMQIDELLIKHDLLISAMLFKDYQIWVQDCIDLDLSPETLLILRNEPGVVDDPIELRRYASLDEILIQKSADVITEISYWCLWQTAARMKIQFKNGDWTTTLHTASGVSTHTNDEIVEAIC